MEGQRGGGGIFMKEGGLVSLILMLGDEESSGKCLQRLDQGNVAEVRVCRAWGHRVQNPALRAWTNIRGALLAPNHKSKKKPLSMPCSNVGQPLLRVVLQIPLKIPHVGTLGLELGNMLERWGVQHD